MTEERTKCTFDGRCGPPVRGGQMWWSYTIDGPDGRTIGNGECGPRDQNTSNMAEYAGLLTMMRRLKEMKVTGAEIGSRSEMIVKMVNSEWGKKKPHKKSPHLQPYLMECRKLLKDSGHRLEWIRNRHKPERSAIPEQETRKDSPEKPTVTGKGQCRKGGYHTYENDRQEWEKAIFRCSKCGDRAPGWEKKKKKKKKRKKPNN